jgi:hypothetical protein
MLTHIFFAFVQVITRFISCANFFANSHSERGSSTIFGFEAFFSALTDYNLNNDNPDPDLPDQLRKGMPSLETLFPGNNQTTQTHTWTQNASEPNVHSERTIVIESGQPQRPRHPLLPFPSILISLGLGGLRGHLGGDPQVPSSSATCGSSCGCCLLKNWGVRLMEGSRG